MAETYLQLIKNACLQLRTCRNDITRRDLIILLARKYLQISESQLRLRLYNDEPAAADIGRLFAADIEKLAQDWPLAYVSGFVDFFNSTYKIVPGVLIPRPDSEVLVEEVLESINSFPKSQAQTGTATFARQETVAETAPEKLKILEIGIGSGALLAAIAGESARELELTGTDINPAAIALSRENLACRQVKAHLEEADIFPSLTENERKYDIIYSNPPYISASEMQTLPASVAAYEPQNALQAAENGLYFYRKILQAAPAYLVNGGYILFEHGYRQKKPLQELLKKYSYDVVKWRQDYGGRDRVLVLRYFASEL